MGEQEEEDGPLSPVQWRQVAQVITEFPDVFVDKPGETKGWEHKIVTPLGWVVRSPLLRLVPLEGTRCQS